MKARSNAVSERQAQELIDFVIRWAPFGGGDEDIFPQFGITPTEFYRRAIQLLREHSAVVDLAGADELITYCVKKSITTSPRSTHSP